MNITKIQGKLYNITDFKHPGGEMAKWHAKGRDSTALFKSHHPFVSKEKLQMILEKYEVDYEEYKGHLLPGEDNQTQFKWGTDFQVALLGNVKDYFLKLAKGKEDQVIKATKGDSIRLIVAFLLTLLHILCIVMYFKANLIATLVLPWAIWFNVQTFHEACHFSLTNWPKVNRVFSLLLPEMSTPTMWSMQHNIGHHQYTNVARKDPDLSHNPQLYRIHSSIKYKPFHFYQNTTFLFVWGLAVQVGMKVLNPLRVLRKGTYNNCHQVVLSLLSICLEILQIVFYMYAVIVFPFTHLAFGKALFFSVYPVLTFSLIFMLNTQLTHIHEDSAHSASRDWYIHQILTSTNHSVHSPWAFHFSGGLNFQIEHHLFPNVNHQHLPAISAIVKKLCVQYRVPYIQHSGFQEAFASFYDHLYNMGKLDKLKKIIKLNAFDSDLGEISTKSTTNSN